MRSSQHMDGSEKACLSPRFTVMMEIPARETCLQLLGEEE